MKKVLLVGTLLGMCLVASDGAPKGPRDSEPSPVPEPATIGMLGIGVGAIAFGAWRKNRKR
ncbi:MAG: PEP-CTERM sorting domain-containing protein [Acidobacteria bacterium]|nr:PEP-CTERM sorting domain-containing protein [Acidobacteriota bacterium]